MIARYRRLLPYARRYRGRYLFGAALVVAAVTLRMTVPTLLGDALDDLRGYAEQADSPADSLAGRPLLLLLSLGIVAAAIAGALVRAGSRLSILGNSRRAVHDLRRDLFDHLLRLPPSFYVRHRTGHVMSRCVNDMQNVQGLLGPVFLYLVETGVLYVVGLFFMLTTDPWLTLVGLLPFPVFLYRAWRLAGRIQELSRRAQEQLGDVGAKLDESLSGQRVVRSLALEEHDRRRFDQEAGAYRATMLALARTRASLAPSMVMLTSLSAILVLAVGGPRVAAGETTVGELVSFLFYLGILAGPTATLGFVISSLQRGASALQRIGELLDMPSTISDSAEVRRQPIEEGRVEVRGLSIEFAPLTEQPHLSGSLPEDADESLSRSRRVLDDVSFEIEPGHTLGVVGPTGCGKTTLLRALSRQVEVAPGQVFIDGRDITCIALEDLRAAVGMAPQESFLFSRSLAENIALGRPAAERSEIEAAVATAELDKDMAQLPDGLDTLVGERGVRLSGGQRQRAALARVVLLSPTLLLLDDTLSAVDASTADQILSALRPLMAGRSTVIVAHRVATVAHADQIIVLDEGRLIERGSHAELVARGGLYASLWRQQEAES